MLLQEDLTVNDPVIPHFMNLPRELRNMIYYELWNPPPPRVQVQYGSHSMQFDVRDAKLRNAPVNRTP